MKSSIRVIGLILLVGMLQAGKPGEVIKEQVLPFSRAGGGRAIAVNPADFSAKQPTDTLYYYNAVDYDAIGLTSGGTYEAAIRLTPTELAPFANWKLIEVRFYHHESVSHSGNIKIYAQGTTAQPGALITSQPYTAPTSGWISVTLANPVVISGSADIWVSVEITHAAGQYPISVDMGPAVITKGDYVYAASLGWGELYNYGLNYNWDIEAIVQMQGDELDPLPPSNLTAYSDYTTPTSITLNWTDPTTRVNGSPIGNFVIQIKRTSELNPAETLLVAEVNPGVQTYTDAGLTDGVRYTYPVRTRTTDDDSLSVYVSASWYAGGDPWPAPPTLTAVNVITEDTVELVGNAPSTQRDGTPLDDLAGIKVYINGSYVHTKPLTTPGATFRDTVAVIPGTVTAYTTAVDNETPQHESAPSNSITVITNVHAGGPDGFGYTFKDSDYPTGPEFIWIDASAGTTITLTDDSYTTLTLPFSFPFYDLTLTSINLCSNGFLETSTATTYTNYDLPYASIPYLIAFFWDDLNPGGGGTIRYLATADYAVIHFDNVIHFGGTGTYNMEVILYPNGDIAMSYMTMTGLLNSSTIGIQGNAGANNWYLKYCYNGVPTLVHDNLTIYWKRPVMEHDLGITSIIEPEDLMALQAFSPEITVRNTGAATETNVDVECIIRKGTEIVYGDTFTISSIAPDVVQNITFESFTPPVAGLDYSITATLLFSDDNNLNNTLSKSFIVYGAILDFEADNGGFNPDAGTGWEWGVPTYGPSGAHSGMKCWATLLGADYPNSADWSLYSPTFVATANAPSFAFFHWYNMENTWDGGNVAVSINGGPYSLITPRRGYDQASVYGLGEPGFSGTSAGWIMDVFDLPAVTTGDNFTLRFRFGSDASVVRPGWYIDDFIFGDFLVSSITEPGSRESRVIVNSIVKGSLLNLSIVSDGVKPVEISLLDVSGREVVKLYSGLLKNGSNELNLKTNLPQGIYFMKVKVGDESTVRRVVLIK